MGVVMRNMLTLMALMISSTGIFVTLAREELRCRLGFSSTECPVTDQAPLPTESGQGVADPPTSSHPHPETVHYPDPQSPSPNRDTFREAADHLREKVTSKLDVEETNSSSLPQSPTQQTPADGAIAAPNSTPHIPVTSRENAVDTAILGQPAPPKPVPDIAPIAPPAAKNSSNPYAIPVTPAQGIAIPVTPPHQE